MTLAVAPHITSTRTADGTVLLDTSPAATGR